MIAKCVTKWSAEDGGRRVYFSRSHIRENVGSLEEARAKEEDHNRARMLEGMEADGWRWEIASVVEVKS